MMDSLRRSFEGVPDRRKGQNARHEIKDAGMSAEVASNLWTLFKGGLGKTSVLLWTPSRRSRTQQA
jgi:hypothetical protein